MSPKLVKNSIVYYQDENTKKLMRKALDELDSNEKEDIMNNPESYNIHLEKVIERIVEVPVAVTLNTDVE